MLEKIYGINLGEQVYSKFLLRSQSLCLNIPPLSLTNKKNKDAQKENKRI